MVRGAPRHARAVGASTTADEQVLRQHDLLVIVTAANPPFVRLVVIPDRRGGRGGRSSASRWIWWTSRRRNPRLRDAGFRVIRTSCETGRGWTNSGGCWVGAERVERPQRRGEVVAVERAGLGPAVHTQR